MKKLIIIGMGGHSKVVTDIAILNGYKILGYLDDNELVETNRELYLGSVETLHRWARDDINFIIAIGNNLIRKSIAERLRNLDLCYAKLIHPSAIIGSKVEILRGTVVMPGAIINADAKIGEHVIVNTAAVIDHDCRVGDFVHISQGAVLAGGVKVESNSHIIVGTRIRPYSVVGDNCVTGVFNSSFVGSGELKMNCPCLDMGFREDKIPPALKEITRLNSSGSS